MGGRSHQHVLNLLTLYFLLNLHLKRLQVSVGGHALRRVCFSLPITDLGQLMNSSWFTAQSTFE